MPSKRSTSSAMRGGRSLLTWKPVWVKAKSCSNRVRRWKTPSPPWTACASASGSSKASSQDLDAKIKPLEIKLYDGSVRNPKELTDLQKELDHYKAQRDKLDEQGIALMDSVQSGNQSTRRRQDRGHANRSGVARRPEAPGRHEGPGRIGARRLRQAAGATNQGHGHRHAGYLREPAHDEAGPSRVARRAGHLQGLPGHAADPPIATSSRGSRDDSVPPM